MRCAYWVVYLVTPKNIQQLGAKMGQKLTPREGVLTWVSTSNINKQHDRSIQGSAYNVI